MFSTSNWSRVTAACVVAMIMMMVMTDAAAMPKAGDKSKHKTHKKLADGAEIEVATLQLHPDALVNPTYIRPLGNASISPWTYDVSHDDSLYPTKLSEARCLLRGCLDSAGQEDLNLESRPIMHHVLVLRRVQGVETGSGAEHSYHFRLESRLIAVGCTCVRPFVQHQQ